MTSSHDLPPILKKYSEWAVHVKKHAQSTIDNYLHYLRNLANHATAHGQQIESLTPSDLERFVESYSAYSSSTQAQLEPALKRFYEFLVAENIRDDDPAREVTFVKRKPGPKRPRDSVAARVAKLPARDAEIAHVVGELLDAGLTIDEVFLIHEPTPVPMRIDVHGARGGPRQIALSEHTRARLDSWGGHFPIDKRQFQKITAKAGFSPKQLGDPLRPGLSDLRRALLPNDTLHKALERRARPAYLRGEHDTAIFEAMKAVEIAVRDTAELPADFIGVTLMREAFNPSRGPLRDETVVEKEREAASSLFAGAIGFFKNPHSHREIDLRDPIEVAGVIRLADVLLRVVDRARP